MFLISFSQSTAQCRDLDVLRPSCGIKPTDWTLEKFIILALLFHLLVDVCLHLHICNLECCPTAASTLTQTVAVILQQTNADKIRPWWGFYRYHQWQSLFFFLFLTRQSLFYISISASQRVGSVWLTMPASCVRLSAKDEGCRSCISGGECVRQCCTHADYIFSLNLFPKATYQCPGGQNNQKCCSALLWRLLIIYISL